MSAGKCSVQAGQTPSPRPVCGSLTDIEGSCALPPPRNPALLGTHRLNTTCRKRGGVHTLDRLPPVCELLFWNPSAGSGIGLPVHGHDWAAALHYWLALTSAGTSPLPQYENGPRRGRFLNGQAAFLLAIPVSPSRPEPNNHTAGGTGTTACAMSTNPERDTNSV